MAIDLSKKDKKIARTLIEKGIQKEFHDGLLKMDAIIQQWKIEKTDNREAYLKLYKALTDFDEHIADRYDGMTGSSYIFIVAGQVANGLVNEEELNELDEKVKNAILFIAQR